MLKNRHFISYFSTTLIYLAIAGIALFMEEKVRVLEKTSEEKTIHISLSSFVPEVLPVREEPKIEEEPMVKEEPVAKEETLVEPEIIKEPILAEKKLEIEEESVSEPIVKKIIPKPIVQKPKKKTIKKKTLRKKRIKKRKVQKKRSSKQVASRKSKSSKAKKNQFLANIRAKINRHKSYPKIAKKRGMQGSVKVTFTMLRSGKVGNISVSGPKVFHHSARKAVKSAFPIGTKNIPLSLPLKINITLRYQIR